jgi:hypothetical protein
MLLREVSKLVSGQVNPPVDHVGVRVLSGVVTQELNGRNGDQSTSE